MRKYLLGALCAVMSLALLAGCTKTTAAPGGSGSADASGSTSGIISTLPDPGDQAIPAQVTADWSEDAVSDSWDTVPAESGDGAAAVTFTTDSTVKNFEILSLTTDLAQDGTASYTLGDVLYAMAELPQENSVTAELVFIGVLPNLAVRYQETDGTERCFTLTVSGEDGSLLMTDISGEIQ